MRHAFATGLVHCIGEQSPSAKTTEAQVRAFCEYMTNGEDHSHETYAELGAKFNMTEGMVVHLLITGDTWRQITSEYGLPGNYVKRSINYERFTEEEVHKMCDIFVRMEGHDFTEIFHTIINELGYTNHPNLRELRHKIHKIYHRRKGCYVGITSQYNYKIS